MKHRGTNWKRIAGLILMLTLVLGLVPGMPSTAYAAGNITIKAVAHGSATADVGSSAEQGATVTLTATPDPGYRLKGFTGTYNGYVEETVNYNKSLTYGSQSFNHVFSVESGHGDTGGRLDIYTTLTISSKDNAKITKVVLERASNSSKNNRNQQLRTDPGTLSFSGGDPSKTVIINLNSPSPSVALKCTSYSAWTFSKATVKSNVIKVNNLSLKSNSANSNVYTFTMPEVVQGAVTITPVFVPSVTSVELNKTATTLKVGGPAETLTATVKEDSADDKTVTWSSNNTSVATVDGTGKITPKTAGTAIITATATNGTPETSDDKTATCTVTVDKGDGSIAFETPNLTKKYGDAAFSNNLTKVGDGSVSYTSSVPTVATVDNNGQVTICGLGNTTITATVEDGANYKYATNEASYELTVDPGDMTVIAEDFNGPYDGQPHSINVNVSAPTSGATITYGTTDGAYDLSNNPTFTDVGDRKTVYFKVTAPNYYDYTGSAAVTISKATWPTPAAPAIDSATINSITLTSIDNVEYRCGDGEWQDSPIFTGLAMNTEYTFYQRVKGDDNHDQSPESQSKLRTLDHVHQWTYTADGATITATCGNSDGGHGDPPTATLTINAPALTTYGEAGQDANATFTGSIDGVTNPDIVYKKGSEILPAAPTNAGTYTASITLGEATASVEYTINRRAVTVSGITANGKTYDGTTETILVTEAAIFNEKLDSDTLTVSATGAFDNADVGENKTVTISDLALGGDSMDNYVLAVNGQQANTTATITAKEVVLDWGDSVFTYNGTPQKPTATATGLLDGDICTVTVTGEQTNAGEYTATAASLDNDNYMLPGNNTTTFKINKADAVAANVTANNRTYDGTEKMLVDVDESTLVGGTMKYALREGANTSHAPTQFVESIPKATSAKTYYVWYKVVGDDNHNAFDAAEPVEVTIAKASITPTVSIKGWTYGGTANTPSVTGNTGNGAVTYTYATKGGNDYSESVPSAAGEYTVKATVAATDNYAEATATADFTINPASVTLTANSGTETYDGTEKTVTGFTSSVEGLTFTGVSASGSGTNADEYDVTFTGVTANETKDSTGNYVVTGTTDGKLTINPASVTLTANSGTETYDGTEKTVTGFTSSVEGLTFTGVSASGSGTNADEYDVTFTGVTANETKDSTGNYVVTGTTDGKLTINLASVTLTANSGTETYDGTEKTVTGFISSVEGLTFTGVSASGSGTNAGEYDVTFTGVTANETKDSTGNYVVTGTTNGKLTINKATSTATAPTPNTLTYNGEAQALVTSGEATGGTMQYALGTATEATQPYITSIPTATDAGTYYVWYKVEGDGNHTDVSPVSVTVHIYTSGAYVSKAPTAKYLFYTGEAQELVEAGTAGGGTMRYALGTDTETVPQEFTYTLPTGTKAGTYYVWYKASGDWNHYDTAAACITVTIYPAGDDEESMPHYDGTPQPLVKPGTIEGGTIEYALGTSDQEAPTEGWSEEIPTGVNPGEYYVWYRIKGDANHNDVAPACVKVTLGKAPIYPVVSLTGWTYGQEANEPSVEENTGNGTVEYLYSSEEEGEYTKEVPVNAGTYYVKASVAETEYYRAGVSKPLSFAISKASINIQAVNKTSKLGGKLKKLTYKVTGDYVLGDKLGIKLKTTAKKAKAGKYKITVSWNKNPNYQAKLIKGTYTVKDRITKAEKKAAKAKLNKGLKVTAKGNKLTVQWGAVSKAGRYEVWAAYKGSKAYRKVGTVKGSVRKLTFSKLNGKKLNLKKGVNVYVKVYRKVNKKMALITKSKVKTIKR